MSEEFNRYDDAFFKEYEEKYMSGKTFSSAPVARRTQKRKKRSLKLPIVILAVLLVTAIGTLILRRPAETALPPQGDTAPIQAPVNEPVVDTVPDYYAKFTENTVDLGDKVNSEYAILIDITNGVVVAHKNSDVAVSPASMTKIMTALVAAENITDWNATFQMTAEIIDPLYRQQASITGFSHGENVTMLDLLYGAILPSGADATCALSIAVAGSEDAFAELMTQKAKSLGLKTTQFSNSSGLYDKGNYCSVHDMAVILGQAIKNDLCKMVLSTYQYTSSKTPQHPEGLLLTSTLFSRIYGTEPEGATIVAGKTGFTSEAGNCIASYGVSDSGTEYIFVTAKANGSWKAIYDHINIYSEYAK